MKSILSYLYLYYCLLSALPTLGQTEDDPQLISPLELRIHAVCNEVLEKGNTTDKLTENDLANLPVGIAREISGTTYIIAIDSAYSTEKGWFLTAYASIIFPGTTKPIAFAARNIPFTGGGITTEKATLYLASRHRIPFHDHLSLELKNDGRNYIEFDCEGFRSINLKGSFSFSEGLLVPDTTFRNARKVTATFEVNTGDLNNIIAAVSITPFQIKGLKDISFSVKNAVADFSDIANPPDFRFPADYHKVYDHEITLWRGFYLRELDVNVRLSSDSGSVKSFGISAQHVILDDLGITGVFSATHLLSLQEGSAGGWPLSIDKLALKIRFNHLNGGSLEGALQIPFLGENPLHYKARVEQSGNNLNYLFAVKTDSAKEFSTPFMAKLKIDRGSVITLEKRGGKIIPSALLNGTLSVEQSKIKVSQLRFERLALSGNDPFVQGGVFSLTGGKSSRSLNYPIEIDHIRFVIDKKEAGLQLSFALNLMEGKDKGFTAKTKVSLLAKIVEKHVDLPSSGEKTITVKRHHWEFSRLNFNSLDINCNTALKLKGKISIFDGDPVYGDGFRGSITLSIKNVLERGVKVNAYFGSKETFRYWHVDAYVPTSSIPIVPPILLTGLLGGASYKMVRKQAFLPDFTALSPEAAEKKLDQDPVYVPDAKASLAFLAGATLVIGNENAVNADVMFEVAFNESGGIRYVQFDGSAFFMTALNQRGRTKGGEPATGPVFAKMNMVYDNDNDVFHSSLSTYVNIAGTLTGSGPKGFVGEAVVHVDRNDWYIYIGRPSRMFGVNVLNVATAQTYFMTGTKIEGLPLPPPEVREIFEGADLRLMRDDMAMAGGKGFGAGLHFKLGYDSKNSLKPFYIALALGGGTDVMIRNYGDMQCSGRSGPVGINGWYASGQAYVFLKGHVGILVGSKAFNIVDLGLASLLQASLPNPTWLKGQMAGNYAVMGGLVKGKFHLTFVAGEACEVSQDGNEIEEINIISDIRPNDKSKEVNVFSVCQVAFNSPIDTEFSLMEGNTPSTYRIKLDNVSVNHGTQVLSGKAVFNDRRDWLSFQTPDLLPENTDINLSVKIHWERKNQSSQWEPVRQNGEIQYEEKHATFHTGQAPNTLEKENIAFCYPLEHQYNFHIHEHPEGYVKLKTGQAYLFKTKDEQGLPWDYKARFQSTSETLESSLRYDENNAMVTFPLPNGLKKNTVYHLVFIKKPIEDVMGNTIETETSLTASTGNEIVLATKKINQDRLQGKEKTLYESWFRTSDFETFEKKWVSLSGWTGVMDIAQGNVMVAGNRSSAHETFDEWEVGNKNEALPSMIQLTALPDNAWIKNHIAPLIYNNYPLDGNIDITWRNPQVLGILPLKGVKLTHNQPSYRLSDAEANTVAPAKSGEILLGYYLSYYSFKDFNELRNKAAARYLNQKNASPDILSLLSGTYVDLLAGDYPVEISYTLPGIGKTTFKKTVFVRF